MKNQIVIQYARNIEPHPLLISKSVVAQMGFRMKSQWMSGFIAEKPQEDGKPDRVYITTKETELRAEFHPSGPQSNDLIEIRSILIDRLGAPVDSTQDEPHHQRILNTNVEESIPQRRPSFSIPWAKIPFTLSICGLLLIYFTAFFIIAKLQDRTLLELAYTTSAASFHSFVDWNVFSLTMYWLPHFSWLHLLTTLIGFFGLGMILETRLGSIMTALLFFLTGIIGVNFHMVFGASGIPILGGSGHVVALLFAIGAYNFMNIGKSDQLQFESLLFALPCIIYTSFTNWDFFSPAYFSTMCIVGFLTGCLFTYCQSLSDPQLKWLAASIQAALTIIAVVISIEVVEYEPALESVMDQMVNEKSNMKDSDLLTRSQQRTKYEPAVLGKDFHSFQVEMTSIYSMMDMASQPNSTISLTRSYQKNLEDKSIYYWKEAHSALGLQLDKDLHDLYYEKCRRLQVLCQTQLSKCEYINKCLKSNKMPDQTQLAQFDETVASDVKKVHEIEAVIWQLEHD